MLSKSLCTVTSSVACEMRPRKTFECVIGNYKCREHSYYLHIYAYKWIKMRLDFIWNERTLVMDLYY